MNNTKRVKCIVCVIMSFLMIVGAVFSVAAFESEISQTGASSTVYFENNRNWSSVYCYMWNGSGEQKNAEWPGQQMTVESGNVYKYTTTTDYQNVIFNNGSGGDGNQTSDLQFPGNGQIYNGSTWAPYKVEPTTPTTPTTPNPNPTTPTTPTPTDGSYVYCKNAANWGQVCCYMWKDGMGDNGTWPGVQMESIGDNVYRYKVTGSWNMIIFNNGSDNAKTGDMSYPGANKIYNNSTNAWEDFDTSPIFVKSYTTDVEGTLYKGMEVTLSTNATSTGGAVTYKYSVTNGSSTTVIKNFSTATSATWTPTVAGSYTLVFDYKDAAGNLNQKKINVTVADDAGVKSPIIKQVTPAQGQVKNNASMNIKVNAGGGKVGTNLLFYKYTVKDSAGKIINIPYYTKNASYTYMPVALGKFTVTVSVQASNNDTVERVYNYESVLNPVGPGGDDSILGDVDGDTVISVMDATAIQRHMADIVALTSAQMLVADFDGDGQVSVMDATAIQRKVAQII